MGAVVLRCNVQLVSVDHTLTQLSRMMASPGSHQGLLGSAPTGSKQQKVFVDADSSQALDQRLQHESSSMMHREMLYVGWL